MVLKMTPKPDTQISFPRVGLMGGSASGLVQLWLNQQPWSRTQFPGFQPPGLHHTESLVPGQLVPLRKMGAQKRQKTKASEKKR